MRGRAADSHSLLVLQRLPRLGIAIAVLLVTAGPFLFNCWRVYGDPLYAINVHADIYRESEGQVLYSIFTDLRKKGSAFR